LKMVVAVEASRRMERDSQRGPQTVGRVESSRMVVEVARDCSAKRVRSRA